MSDWKIGLSPQTAKGTPSIIGPLTALIAWKRLSAKQRAAVEAAYPDGVVKGHWATHASLERHGFVAWDNAAQACVLTPAGREVFRWVDKP